MTYTTYFRMFRAALAMAVLIFISGSCTKDSCTHTIHYQVQTPVYKSFAEVRAEFGTKAPLPVGNPGKIYVYGKYLLVNEQGKGIHIIDNTNPESPVNVSFINIPGNVDMAVRNNILYADCYVDLLAIDITDPMAVTLKSRLEGFYKNLGITDPDKGIIVNYTTETVTQTYSECNPSGPVMIDGGIYIKRNGGMVLFDAKSNTTQGTATTGTAGSMARFVTEGDYLYGVDLSSLYTVNVADPQHPSLVSTLQTSGEIESIFPYKGKLFIGGYTGMYIYNIDNPASPSVESNFGHVTSCDPVVVNDKFAFITLHSGSPCHTHDGVNELDVADITDIHNPVMRKTYGFTHPLGLGVDGNTLFICDDNDGLKVFDASDPDDIISHQLGKYDIKGAYDVIPADNLLIVTAQNAIYEYDYSNPANLKLLSTMSLTRQ